jgi:hypothetical protein
VDTLLWYTPRSEAEGSAELYFFGSKTHSLVYLHLLQMNIDYNSYRKIRKIILFLGKPQDLTLFSACVARCSFMMKFGSFKEEVW